MEDPRDFRARVLDPISPTFCAAKWLGGTIWLSSGQTASCFHPPSHRIEPSDLIENPSGLHNTPHKKLMRKMMLEGEKPRECEYCWNMEAIGQIGDRPLLSMDYADETIRKIAALPWDADIDPEYLEIAFDRNCNLACAYCNSGFSSTWGLDIKKHGPYLNLSGSTSEAYRFTGTGSDMKDHSTPYVDAFFRWWPSLAQTLRHIRITGGEPLMSPHFWTFMERVRTDAPSLRVSVNTNLQTTKEKLERLLGLGTRLHVFTSNETVFEHAEYIRDGLVFTQWHDNVSYLLETDITVRVMMSVNNLCLERMPELLDMVLDWRSRGGRIEFATNIVLYPPFHNPSVLPDDLRNERRNSLEKWFSENEVNLRPRERSHLERVIAYLEHGPPIPEGQTFGVLQNDMRVFYEQYDRRRMKDMRSVFPDVADWLFT